MSACDVRHSSFAAVSFSRGESSSLLVMFNSYDLNGDGKLSPDEIYNIFRTSLKAQGGYMAENELRELVVSTIRSIDQNNDGQIDFNEFKQAVQSNKLAFLFPK